jgi:hypothetical protein
LFSGKTSGKGSDGFFHAPAPFLRPGRLFSVSSDLSYAPVAYLTLRRLFSMFEAAKHCFFSPNNVFWEKTLFEPVNSVFFAVKHCLSPKIHGKTEKTMF